MYMGDIKLFDKTEKLLGTLIQTVRIYSQSIHSSNFIQRDKRLVSPAL